MRCLVAFGVGFAGIEGSAGQRQLARAPGRVAQTERSGVRRLCVFFPLNSAYRLSGMKA